MNEIILIALAFRIILLFVNPITSDDYYRYLWDGKVQSEGINPYEFAPQELSNLQDNEIYPNLTFPEIKTIYPPLAQVLFFLSYKLFGANAFGLKIFYFLLELGIIIFLFKILKVINVNTNYIFLYVLSPLVIFEFFINVHIDIELLFFLTTSIYFALKNNINLSLLFLGFSVMSKVYSLIFFPVYMLYFLKLQTENKKLFAGITFFILSFAVILFYQSHIIEIFFTMKNYMQNWYSNNLIYKIINSFIKLFGIENHQITRLILILIFLIVYVIILKSNFTLIQKLYLISYFYLFFSHTVHPWYVTVLVLFLPICFNYSAIFWSSIIGLTNLTVYYYLKDKIWNDYMPVLITEYLVLAVLIIYDIKIFKLKNVKLKK